MIPGEYPISFFLTTRHCTGQGVHRSLGVHLIRCSLLIWQGTRCTAGGQHLILGSGFLISFLVFSFDKTGQGTRCRVHTWLKGSTWSFSWSASAYCLVYTWTPGQLKLIGKRQAVRSFCQYLQYTICLLQKSTFWKHFGKNLWMSVNEICLFE